MKLKLFLFCWLPLVGWMKEANEANELQVRVEATLMNM
jgi:hypothetical protein